jgi:hypothetical protein
VQLGSMISCDSMFHRVSNASKAAYGQTLVHLQKRGFKLVDTNGVADHQVNYGEEWLARWQFERQTFECLKERPSLTDDRPYPQLPWEIRTLLPMLNPARKVLRRMPWAKAPRNTAPPTPPEAPVGATEKPAISTPNEPQKTNDRPTPIS